MVHMSKCLKYAVYPVFLFLLSAGSTLRAQDTTQPQQPQSQTEQQGPISELPTQTPQQRAQVLRQAQQRVRARREQRDKQIIQDTYSHKYEIYFGSCYLRFRPGHTLQHMDEGMWNVGFTDWVHGNWGVTGDVRGYYGRAYTHPNELGLPIFHPSISQYSFMAGPQYHFFEGVHWGWSAQLLGGMGHGNWATGTGGVPANLVGLYSNTNVLNLSAGAQVDYNLSPSLAIRLLPMMLVTKYGSNLQPNLGFTVTGVYRWGRK